MAQPKHSISCSLPNCSKVSIGSENNIRYCRRHLRHLRKYKIPEGGHVQVQNATIDDGGYRKWSINGRVIREHRLVMELALGRRLKSSEIVHHKDHNKLNNELDNLELTDRAHHRYSHAVFQDETSKECSKCHKIKPLTDFYVRKTFKDRRPHLSWCIECDRAAYWNKPPRIRRRASLNPEKVTDIRARYASGDIDLGQTAKEFGVTISTLWYVIANKTWKHVQ